MLPSMLFALKIEPTSPLLISKHEIKTKTTTMSQPQITITDCHRYWVLSSPAPGQFKVVHFSEGCESSATHHRSDPESWSEIFSASDISMHTTSCLIRDMVVGQYDPPLRSIGCEEYRLHPDILVKWDYDVWTRTVCTGIWMRGKYMDVSRDLQFQLVTSIAMFGQLDEVEY